MIDGTAIEAIAGLERRSKAGETREIDGEQFYFDGEGYRRICWNPTPTRLDFAGIEGLAAYLLADSPYETSDLTAIVSSPTTVEVFGPEDPRDLNRTEIASATLDRELKTFPFGQWHEQESFLIGLYSMFTGSDRAEKDLTDLAAFASRVEDEEAVTTDDDGVTQRVTAKAGVSGAKREAAPRVVILQPYRTFREIEQPESMFIFRMRKDKDATVRFALFEADGGSWRLAAMNGIRGYLRERVTGMLVA